jgi:apolipoprotein D and lipocalin family protein
MKPTLIASLLCLCALDALAADPAAVQARASAGALTTIASLDVPRYMGTWYEIAKFPNWFQKKCVGNTRAEYSLKAEGTVQVINRCMLESGEINEAVGTARRVGAADSPRLQVRFAPAWLSFIPAVWGDYWVIDLDDAYQLVAVSEPERAYLWVLSRTPRVDPKAYEALLERLAQKGFDVDRLEPTRQQD